MFIISINIIINNYINLFLLINADKTQDPETASREILAEENVNENTIEDNFDKVPGLIENKLLKVWIAQCPGLVHCRDKYMDTFWRKGQVVVVETNYGHKLVWNITKIESQSHI